MQQLKFIPSPKTGNLPCRIQKDCTSVSQSKKSLRDLIDKEPSSRTRHHQHHPVMELCLYRRQCKSIQNEKMGQMEIAIICYCAIKSASDGHVHASIRRLFAGYQTTSRFYMRVVFPSLVVSCQGHSRNGKLKSSKRNEVVLRPRCAFGYNVGYNFTSPRCPPFYRVASWKVSSY